jgi:DNA-binding NtrC family response regulator
MQYPWPGNVRELENTIERAVIFSIHPIILPEDLPQRLLESVSEGEEEKLEGKPPLYPEKLLPLKAIEKSYVLRVLEETKGNKKKAAEILGIDRTTLYRILEKE